MICSICQNQMHKAKKLTFDNNVSYICNQSDHNYSIAVDHEETLIIEKLCVEDIDTEKRIYIVNNFCTNKVAIYFGPGNKSKHIINNIFEFSGLAIEDVKNKVNKVLMLL